MTNRIGLLLGSTTPPEDIARLAREVEDRGFGELWIPEDYFFLGGIAASAIALGATERIPVGLAVVSSMVRHPALLTMETATLARAYPGRFKPGIGHGVPAWTAQMGLAVKSPMSALRETLTGVSSLLAGETVDDEGRVHSFRGVALAHPPTEPVPIYTGVLGDKGIAMTGELADGIVVSVLATPDYVRATREKLDTAALAAGRDDRPEQVVLVAMNLTRDPAQAAAVREQIKPVLAFYIAATGPCPLFASIGANAAIADMIARGGADTVAAEMPDEWVDAFSVTGGPDDGKAGIATLLASGADKVVVVPVVADNAEETLACVAGLVPEFSS